MEVLVRLPLRSSALAVAAVTAVALLGVAPAASAEPPSDLFLSEVVEGSSNNKAVEIYNGTGAPVDLSAGGYALQYFFNGGVNAGLTITLTGTVASGDVHVVAQSSANAVLLEAADQTNGAGWFNGDDAIALVKGGVLIDVFGQIGFDPGTEWGTGLVSTADNTLRRQADVCAGDPSGSDAFDPASEWDGFATDTFDGIGTHTADCGDVEPSVVINEFSASTAGTDVEYVELLARGVSDLSGYALLGIEGDAPVFGVVDNVLTFPAPDATGRSLLELPANTLENGTLSLLLVTGTIPAAGSDIDANDDGVIDEGLGFEIVDSVAVNDGGAGDRTYGTVTLGVAYDGLSFAPGGASRIPDGVDTDATSDWTRNDFDLAGIDGFTGTLATGEAVNTPGAPNALTLEPEGPGEGAADCNAQPVTIGSVQGSGATTPVAGSTVLIEGTVVGDFQSGGFDGYYVQDAGDGNPATSDAVFVYAPGGAEVSLGDVVSVAGTAEEAFGMTQVRLADVEVCTTGAALPAATELTLPATTEQREALEGMRVTLPQQLAVGETFEFGRFGTITLTLGRQFQPTQLYDAGSAEAIALAEKNLVESITVDDGRSNQNPDPAIHPNGQEFTLANLFRSGDLVTDTTGVLDYRFDTWGIQPTQGAEVEVGNPRAPAPQVAGALTVASFNVLNYFTTLTGPDARGANDAVEFERQEAKIVTALAEIDADVFGLIEIENNGTAVATLTDALNARLGSDVYDYVETGVIGGDAITTALLYKPASVTPVGAFQLMDQSKDARWLDAFNRPGLTQSFKDARGATFTVVVNHLKSKGSDCNAVGDPTDPNGQGNCNGVRTQAATALASWLATDPTGQGAGRELILGDLNAYAQEDPMQALYAAGYTDLADDDSYTYIFDGMLGSLDHALAGSAILGEVAGAAVWNVNADEPSLIDYDMSFKAPAQDALYAPDAYRSSDHDPIVVGLNLKAPDLVKPTATVKTGSSFTVKTGETYDLVSFKLYDAGKIDKVTLNGKLKDLTNNTWSDINFIKPGVFGGVRGVNTLVVYDVAGNTQTYTFTLN
ncbi:ExeM/NucH family extracellular endonuclease [Microbacterium sp. SLBN-146]|uniref:ExeM/NucH family extracellular endonuclease n=1 Tax=Microbacterium sp. SLBN-146 TaxID=2768457 RepID=UPI0021B1C03A|nr:ExeM/NucH family extracellular endonuclease [Microbacterium sp. SLBN-146]